MHGSDTIFILNQAAFFPSELKLIKGTFILSLASVVQKMLLDDG